jgi:hypothetical protein
MTCDDFLAAYEAGGAARRAAASHAAGCPDCAAALERWLTLKQQWTETPVLSPDENAAWLSAKAGVVPRSRRPLLVAGLAAASLAAVAVFAFRQPARVAAPEVESRVRVVQLSPEVGRREAAAFERQLNDLEDQIEFLSRRVALEDLRRETADLLSMHRSRTSRSMQ